MWTGWRWLADTKTPEAAAAFAHARPEIASGLVLAQPAMLEAAVAAARTVPRDTAVWIGAIADSTAAVTSRPGTDDGTCGQVLLPHPGTYDRAAADEMLIAAGDALADARQREQTATLRGTNARHMLAALTQLWDDLSEDPRPGLDEKIRTARERHQAAADAENTATEKLPGGPAIPECPEGVLYFSEAGWHTDDGIGVRGVKFAAYFGELDADTGALRLVPGSHHPKQNTRLAAYSKRRARSGDDAGFAAYQASFPGYVAATSPGDMIAFDLHTWHASTGGLDRLAWNVVYLRSPETADERDRTLRSMSDSFEQAYRGFDTGRYPVWRDWLADTAAHPRRAPVIERMRRAGVLDLPGALEGW